VPFWFAPAQIPIRKLPGSVFRFLGNPQQLRGMPDRQVSVTGDEETGFLPAGKDSTRSMQCCAGNIAGQSGELTGDKRLKS